MGKLKALLTGLALGTLVGSLLDPERRAKVKKIALELKVKVAARTKMVTNLSCEAYEKMVDAAAAEYQDTKSLTKEEMDKIINELKAGWEDIKASFK